MAAVHTQSSTDALLWCVCPMPVRATSADVRARLGALILCFCCCVHACVHHVLCHAVTAAELRNSVSDLTTAEKIALTRQEVEYIMVYRSLEFQENGFAGLHRADTVCATLIRGLHIEAHRIWCRAKDAYGRSRRVASLPDTCMRIGSLCNTEKAEQAQQHPGTTTLCRGVAAGPRLGAVASVPRWSTGHFLGGLFQPMALPEASAPPRGRPRTMFSTCSLVRPLGL